MKIELIKIDSIIPYASNPRKNDKAIQKVKASLKEFGWRQPIVVDKENVIIAGHTRYSAARELGFTDVPVHVAAELTKAQVKAYRIADNKIAESAEWDEELLKLEFMGLNDAGFDLALTGFSDEELGDFLSDDDVDYQAEDDDVPDSQEVYITRPGDVWLMGKHRLMCGDSTDINCVSSLADGRMVDLLITDPPYNVAYTGKTKDALTIENDSMSDADFRKFLQSAFTSADAVMKPGAVFYIWHADSEGYNFRGACFDIGWKVRQYLIWSKDTMVLGRQDYHWKHEPCLYGWKDGAAHFWASDRKQVTILDFERPTQNKEHPTMKPVSLFAYQMLNNTRRGDIVLDIFGGSGTTLIAAEKNQRQALVMELDPKYCDVIVRRWQNLTGKSALLESSGEEFPINGQT